MNIVVDSVPLVLSGGVFNFDVHREKNPYNCFEIKGKTDALS